MSLLGFEVTYAYLTFLALFHFLIYVLMSFPKNLLSISLVHSSTLVPIESGKCMLECD
jgi:hypothetical protein